MEPDRKPGKEKKKPLNPKWTGSFPLLLLAVAGVVLLLFGNGLFSSRDGTGTTTDPDAYRVALERELATLCAEVKGVGRISVMITLSEGEKTTYAGGKVASVKPPAVLGAALVCDGGGDPAIKAELTNIATALLGVGANRVTVTERRQ